MIIGLIGDKGVGKYTASLALIKCGYYSLSFYEPIRASVKALFNIRDDDYDPVKKEKFASFRDPEPLNEWLLKVAQEYDPDIIIKNMQKRIEDLRLEDSLQDESMSNLNLNFRETTRFLPNAPRITKIIIPDVRTKEESKFIKDMGGFVIRVVKADSYPKDRTDIDEYTDFVLLNKNFNEGGIERLQSKLRELTEQLEMDNYLMTLKASSYERVNEYEKEFNSEEFKLMYRNGELMDKKFCETLHIKHFAKIAVQKYFKVYVVTRRKTLDIKAMLDDKMKAMIEAKIEENIYGIRDMAMIDAMSDMLVYINKYSDLYGNISMEEFKEKEEYKILNKKIYSEIISRIKIDYNKYNSDYM